MSHVAVVGAGLGGIGAAVRLAAQGHRVTLVEKNATSGGKLNMVEAEGFRFDTGPSLVTLPGVLSETFHAAGRRMEDYLTLEPLEPICRYRYPDGSSLDISSHLPRLVAEVGGFAPGDVTGLFRFLAYARRMFERAGPVFLLRERPRLLDLISRRGLDALRIDAHISMDRAVRRFFKDPRMVQLFDRYATYNGSSPYKAPATLAMIPYLEIAGGGYYVKGGLYRIVESLMEVAGDLGVRFMPECEVEQVNVEPTKGFAGAKATGVRLKDGSDLRADSVIVNADPMYAYPALVPEMFRDEQLMKRMERLEPSCSGFVLLLGVRGDYPELAHHNIFFSRDYRSEFDYIFDRREPAPDPTIYVACTSKSDPTQAPPGHSNLFVLVNAPALSSDIYWPARRDLYRDHILTRLESCGLRGLRERIVYQETITPLDFQEKYHAWQGSLYGLSSNSRSTAFQRPPNRAPGVPNLFFVGGSVHPGGGIPLVLLSARLVSRLVK
ncbi:MAG: phytoene desaturase family protein [Chloroflexota bacterium]|nr:phytoene desaturase family protein [Chloroflexota bacterium]MDQ5867717.1 phytoene desaturase family protein [Chloroflexota bacterium]